MKTIRTFFYSFFLILLISTFAFSQNTDLSPLPGNASLEETKAWLIGAVKDAISFKLAVDTDGKITNNGFSRERNISSTKVTDIAFDGCSLNYTIKRKSEAFTYSDSAGNTSNANNFSDGPISGSEKVSYEKYSLDLGKIDANGLDAGGGQYRLPPGKYPLIGFWAVDKKTGVAVGGPKIVQAGDKPYTVFIVKDSTSKDDVILRNIPATALAVRNGSEGPMRQAFAHAIQLCTQP